MPRARPEPIEEYLLDLEEAGMELPDGLDPQGAYRLAAACSFFVRRRKTVRIESPDLLRVVDRRMAVEVPLATVGGAAGLSAALGAARDAALRSPERTVLWIDAAGSPDPEHLFEHALWGEVMLYAWPGKPPRPRDDKVLAAERAGWTPVLKQFNLLPGRGIVVPDGKLGLIATEASGLSGLIVHVGTGEQLWCPNPFVEERWNDPDFQWWLNWGEGSPEMEWKRVLDTREE